MIKPILASVIFVVILISFVMQRRPAGLTAVVGSLLMMIFGIIEPSDVVAPFGSDTVIMVASVLILGSAVFETGAAEIIGSAIVRRMGRNEKLLIIVLVLTVSILSSFLSNSAVVAIFLPLLASLARSSGGAITKKNTYMAVGIASVVGGNCTLAGSTPQLTAQAILQTTDSVRELTFWELGKVGFPLVIVLALYYLFIGIRLQKKVFDFPEVEDPAPSGDGGQVRSKAKCITVCLIMLGCVAGFTAGVFSFGTVGAIAAALCILTGCISFDKAFKSLDWNTICVLGGAMGISTALNKSGVVQAVADMIISAFGSGANPVTICLVLLVTSAVLGNIMSHTATAAVLTPLAISLGTGLGVDPIPYVVTVVIGCNLAFATPVATPPLTMTMVGGYRFTDYTKVGGLYNLLSLIAAALLIPLAYGL
ncbi:MAG TPA: SLC13/DASS family transporter [Candidatus Scatomorpha intestinigallinarum]|uniref:SLC13/DASS family transporter n=1 Tax=Candidatus Scatomorpha intestinigallinarum TaxID=2840923 RepID=A0A9D1DLX4_9FIRM|nr:SLC13/DASS family transporter [Candidatus Scatomorpha intestinigallinarum]